MSQVLTIPATTDSLRAHLHVVYVYVCVFGERRIWKRNRVLGGGLWMYLTFVFLLNADALTGCDPIVMVKSSD